VREGIGGEDGQEAAELQAAVWAAEIFMLLDGAAASLTLRMLEVVGVTAATFVCAASTRRDRGDCNEDEERAIDERVADVSDNVEVGLVVARRLIGERRS